MRLHSSYVHIQLFWCTRNAKHRKDGFKSKQRFVFFFSAAKSYILINVVIILHIKINVGNARLRPIFQYDSLFFASSYYTFGSKNSLFMVQHKIGVDGATETENRQCEFRNLHPSIVKSVHLETQKTYIYRMTTPSDCIGNASTCQNAYDLIPEFLLLRVSADRWNP